MDYQNLYYFQCIQMKNGEFFELDRINARISFSRKLLKEPIIPPFTFVEPLGRKTRPKFCFVSNGLSLQVFPIPNNLF